VFSLPQISSKHCVERKYPSGAPENPTKDHHPNSGDQSCGQSINIHTGNTIKDVPGREP
jgi:hypothetical protein